MTEFFTFCNLVLVAEIDFQFIQPNKERKEGGRRMKTSIVIDSEIKQWFPIPEVGEVNFEARIRPERIIIPNKVIAGLQSYVRKCLDEISGYSEPRPDGVVIGLSGGIDSTTIAAICKMALQNTRYFVKGIILGRAPLGEQGEMNELEYQDILYALKVAKEMDIDYEYLDISSFAKSVYNLFPDSGFWELSGVLPRIRSILLLQFADNLNAISVGAGNGTEFHLGAFTFGGPGGHIAPLADFYKSEVYKIAEILGVPSYIIERKPAISELGLYDEQLYGASCYILDPIIRRMCWQKKSPEKVAKELGHSVRWLRRIKDLRLEGERGRKSPPPLIVCRKYKKKIRPELSWDRSVYFDNLF